MNDFYNDEEYKIELDEEDLKEEEELKKEESNTSFSINLPSKKNNYFDEERITHLIVDVYQPSLVYDENGKIIKRNLEAEKEILAALLLIVRAIINKYMYWRFDSVEDLEAEGLSACWKYLPKYTPGKGTAFNLFYIICKIDLLNYTIKMKKHRLTADIDICPDVQERQETNYNLFFEDLEATFIKVIKENYEGETQKKYIELTSILMEYLDKNKNIVGKNDLFSAFRAYGYKTTDYKNFIEEMSKYKDEFKQLIPSRR